MEKTVNLQTIPEGFGSYLTNILPEDIATAAGAFNVSMRQIRNIKAVPIEKFSQIVASMETTKGLDLVAGTNVPTNEVLSATGADLIGLGGGPNGTYTMSDMLGAMSGLPYPWKDIQDLVSNLQTTTLQNIYKQIFLSTTWEAATLSVQYSTNPNLPSGPTTYTATGVTITDAGGGYGINGAVAPTITIVNGGGATATCTIGTNNADAGSNGAGTYGRVTAIQFTGGSATTSIPTATIQTPPTSYNSSTNQASGTAGWPVAMSATLQSYIDDANDEIVNIKTNNSKQASLLNKLYNITGLQLTREQRSRELAFPPVPTPKDTKLSQYPMALYSFVDAIPQYATDTLPHMYAQTLEAISDLTTVGGQSIVAMMRQERNQARLSETGIALDNNIPGAIDPVTAKTLMANGSVPAPAGYTLPAVLPGAIPDGYYDPNKDKYFTTDELAVSTSLGDLENTELANVYFTGPLIPASVGTELDTGQAKEPGSLAGSRYQIPTNLSGPFTSKILTPSAYSVPEAIDQVIKCNCDCWLM
jgi:hypothetical protein